jgi:hypothetical protein
MIYVITISISDYTNDITVNKNNQERMCKEMDIV